MLSNVSTYTKQYLFNFDVSLIFKFTDFMNKFI